MRREGLKKIKRSSGNFDVSAFSYPLKLQDRFIRMLCMLKNMRTEHKIKDFVPKWQAFYICFKKEFSSIQQNRTAKSLLIIIQIFINYDICSPERFIARSGIKH